MGHGHTHEISAAGRIKKPLMIVFCLTFFYLIVEVIGGFWTGSLALLADAGHMLTDVAGVGLALLAIWFAEKPASPERTYGYYRVEILAALTNAVVSDLHLALHSLRSLRAVQKSSRSPECRNARGRVHWPCHKHRRSLYPAFRFEGKPEHEGSIFRGSV